MRPLKPLYLCLSAAALLPIVAAYAGDGTIHRMREKVSNSYIVVLEKGQDANAIAPELERAHGGHVAAVMGRLGMFSITLGNETAAENIARDPRVAFVQEDASLHVQDTLRECRTLDPAGSQWSLGHLNDITQRYQFGEFVGSETLANPTLTTVRVYVIDTAINDASPDFLTNGVTKVREIVNYAPISCIASEPPEHHPKLDGALANHGGAVASLIVGNVHGVVPDVTSVVSIVAANSDGCATDSSLSAAANYAIQTHAAGTPAVANVSIASDIHDDAFNAAMKSMVDNGIFVSAAAGNGDGTAGYDACTVSAADLGGTFRYPGFMAVGATNFYGGKAAYSNYGACVDMWAPGGDSYAGVATAAGSETGTSFAAPHVAGAAILIYSVYPNWTPANVWYQIKQNSVNYFGTQSLQVPNGCNVAICMTYPCSPAGQ